MFMNLKKSSIIVLVAILISSATYAQKIKVVSGSLSYLKGKEAVGIEYDYSRLMVGKKTEKEYVTKKVEDANKVKAGAGETWQKAWLADRTQHYQPKFEELLNSSTKGSGINFSSTAKSDAKIVVVTTFIEPGYNIGVSKVPSSINLELLFMDGSTEKAKVTLVGAIGQTYGYGDFDTGIRIGESYAKAAKSLGGVIKKAIKK